MRSKYKNGLVAFGALLGMVSASPLLAATRSAEALPLLAASVGSAPYSAGVENTWSCVEVTDEALKLDEKYVQVDQAGRVVLSPKGSPYSCTNPLGDYKVGSGGGGFPFEILLAILGTAGLVFGLAGGSSSDSNG